MIETNFKHTDIGLIPHDWEVKKLGENASIYRGGSPRPIEAYITNSPEGVNWLKIGDVSPTDKYFTHCAEKITPLGTACSRQVHKGDFILSNSMSFGRPYILKIDGCIHDGWLVIQDYTTSFNMEYLYYVLSSDTIKAQYVSMAAGSSVQNLNKDKVACVQIATPPTLAEQEKIANALSKIDQLINDLGALIEKKKAIKQGTMQDLLTAKRRLKGFTGEWVKKNIWEVTIWDKKFNGVEDYKQPEVKKYPYALAKELFAMEDNSGDVFLLSTGGYSGWTTEKKAGQFMCHGEVVTIPWGGVAIVKYTNGKFVTADNRLATSKNTQVLSNKFLYLAMLIKTDVLNTFYRGASIKHPSMEDVLNLEIFLPPTIAEQNAIANVLSSMDTEITNLEQKRNKYMAIKQGMMQNLLTGKIRLI